MKNVLNGADECIIDRDRTGEAATAGAAPCRNAAGPRGAFSLHIDSLDLSGRGVGRREGKTVFVENALAGEDVLCVYLQKHKTFDEARTVEILAASPQRVEPACPHFGVCGGCAMQHLAHPAQILAKEQVLLDTLRHIGKVVCGRVLPPLCGPAFGYRRKARIGIRYVKKKERVLVGFREKKSRFIADLAVCPVLAPTVGLLIPELIRLVGSLSIMTSLPQVEVAVGDDATALVFRNLAPLSADDLIAFRAFGDRHGIRIFLQPGNEDTAAPLDGGAVELRYRLDTGGRALDFFFRPTDFTQVNHDVNRLLVARVLELLRPRADDRVLDLFCGLGNFTLPLALCAQEVTGVEGDAALIARAGANARAAGIDNCHFQTADLAADPAGAAWTTAACDLVLLDPPRTGAGAVLSPLAKLRPRRMVYVSCNPATLARDAGILCHEYGFELAAAGIADMFPHTAHVESVALFVRPETGNKG